MSDIDIYLKYSLPGTTLLLCAKIPAAVAAASGEPRILHDGGLDRFQSKKVDFTCSPGSLI